MIKPKIFASYPYLARRAAFAALGPAYVCKPRRFVARKLRETLVAHAGRPTNAVQRAEYETAVTVGMRAIKQSIGSTYGVSWQQVALRSLHH
jgi:hypothetical protein